MKLFFHWTGTDENEGASTDAHTILAVQLLNTGQTMQNGSVSPTMQSVSL